MAADNRPIGMLDSGIGGLSILNEVRRQLPHEDLIYFADQSHVPYGPRPKDQIIQFTQGITDYFIEQNAKAVVLACNAASAASLHYLRRTFPDMPFVGMEPAVKPAAERTQHGVIGVVTTKATYQGELFASVVERYANGVKVVTQVCPAFVTQVEAGDFDTDETHQIAQDYLQPLMDAHIDQLVLGCTHFPFLTPVLQDILGPDVEIVDPSPAIARQLGRVIANQRHDEHDGGSVRYFTSGDDKRFFELVSILVEEPVRREQAARLQWEDNRMLRPIQA